ncbi:MAG: hypothetical protein ACOYIK_09210, partial [Coriobacteriales bacterium]|jgi:hypothetical protein
MSGRTGYKMYIPDEEEFESAEFVKTFKTLYFKNESVDPKIKESIGTAPNQTVRWVEDIADGLLSSPKLTEQDIFFIMAWKTGNIKMIELNPEPKDVEDVPGDSYSSGWRIKDLAVSLRGSKKDDENSFAKFAEKIVDHQGELRVAAKYSVEEVLNMLVSYGRPSGIGLVYLLTLVFFLSGGDHPIYDRFAKRALDSIVFGLHPRYVAESKLPDIDWNSTSKKKAIEATSLIIKGYEQLLTRVFDDAWKTERDIDRALWVYGHPDLLK